MVLQDYIAEEACGRGDHQKGRREHETFVVLLVVLVMLLCSF